jgi:alanyl-tRNA synthetase
MRTEKVYYEQPYLKELEATVLSVDGQNVELDRTICYPECGGQPGDRGMIGGCRLLDTQKGKGDEILHVVERPSFSVGDKVLVSLDWPHRFFYMQVHSAQHVTSGLLFTLFHVGTVAVHDGEKILTIETDQSSFDEVSCYKLEDAVNRAIRENHAIHYMETTHAKAEAMHLRRSIKVDGDVRLVIIDGVDTIACGGVHVASTSEIVLVQYVGQETIRGHVRLVFRVAENALEEIRLNRSLVGSLCALHSATADTLLPEEQRADSQAKETKAELLHMKEAMCRKAMEPMEGIVTWDISDEPFTLKEVASSLVDKDLALCAVKKEGEKLYWLFAFLGKFRTFDFNGKRNLLLGDIHGKGGGRPPLYQGMGSGEPSSLFSSFKETLA